MKIASFNIEGGTVTFNHRGGQAYSALFEEPGRAFPSAVGVGTTLYEAFYDLMAQPFAKPFAFAMEQQMKTLPQSLGVAA